MRNVPPQIVLDTINLRHTMNFVKRKFTAEILNDGIVIHSMQELLPIAAKYV